MRFSSNEKSKRRFKKLKLTFNGRFDLNLQRLLEKSRITKRAMQTMQAGTAFLAQTDYKDFAPHDKSDYSSKDDKKREIYSDR